MAGRNVGLTVKEVENARAQQGRDRWLNDGGGLQLHVRPGGTKTWRFRYTGESGQRRIKDLGDAMVRSLADARKEANRLRAIIANGLDPIEEERKAKEAAKEEERRRMKDLAERRTLAAAVDAWKNAQLSMRKDGGAEIMRALTKDVLTVLGDRDLRSIEKGDLMACLDAIVARNARRQANVCLAALKQFYRWCMARDWVKHPPLFDVTAKDVGGKERDRDRFLSINELKQLKAQMPDANLQRHVELAIWILLSTMARVGELSGASWSNVDLSAGIWHIPDEDSKNGKPHTIYLSGFAVRQFRELRALTGWSMWVMPSARKRKIGKESPNPALDRPIGEKSITKQISDRQSAANKSKRTKAKGTLCLSGGRWTSHDLRRTGATLMGAHGVSTEVIERCLNHVEQDKMVRIYQRQDLVPERRQAWQLLGEVLDGILHEGRQTDAVCADNGSAAKQWG